MNGSRLAFVLRTVVRSLWFTPAVYATNALDILAGANTVAPILPDGLKGRIGLSGVYDLLGVLANTLLAVSIFSLGIMASSMLAASSGATPRVRPLLMQDRAAQSAISTFIGGFVHSTVGIVGFSVPRSGPPIVRPLGQFEFASSTAKLWMPCLGRTTIPKSDLSSHASRPADAPSADIRLVPVLAPRPYRHRAEPPQSSRRQAGSCRRSRRAAGGLRAG